jgi:hypothetical protein
MATTMSILVGKRCRLLTRVGEPGKTNTAFELRMSGNYVERVIVDYISKIGTFKTNTPAAGWGAFT